VPAAFDNLRRLAAPAEGSPRRTRALRLLGVAVVGVFAAFALARVDLRQVAGSLAASRPGPLLLGMGATALSLWLHAARWAALVRPPGGRVRARDAFAPMVVGQAIGIAVPARAGDLVRSHLLARRTGLSTASVVAAVFLDYVVGTVTLVPLLAALALATPLPPWARQALLAFAVMAVVGFAMVRALRPPRDHDASGAGLAGLLARLRGGLSAAHEPQALLAAVGWGVAGWGAELLIALFALAALGLTTTFAVAGLLVVATTAANLIALSPGNAGPFEAATVLVLAGLGVPAAPALAFALLYHAVHLAPRAAIALVAVLREAREARA
jgi:uncharacterized membrane protein YbhN (UPF0104 family)